MNDCFMNRIVSASIMHTNTGQMDGNSEYCWLMLINCKPLQAAFGVTWRWISFLIISGLDDRFACQWAGTCLVWGLIQICLETVKVLHSQETLKIVVMTYTVSVISITLHS